MIQRLPLISIGTPVYNGENYLEAAIESLLGQTFTDFELIISDNASTDRTQDICQAFAAQDARIRYERQPQNRGAAWNHNRLVELARGEYFKWASHDDLLAPTYLERCLEPLRSDAGIVWCHSRVAVIDEHGEVISSNINLFGGTGDQSLSREHSVDDVSSPYTRYLRSALRPHQRFDSIVLSSAWSVDTYGLIRAAALRRTRGMLATYGSEKTLLTELSMLGRYTEVPETLFYVRIHPESSGRYRTVAEQQQFVGSRAGSRWIHPRVQLLMDYMTVIARAPISVTERACCLWTIVKYIMQMRKWKRVLRSLTRGTGTGSGNEFFLNRKPAAPAREPQVSEIAIDQRIAENELPPTRESHRKPVAASSTVDT